MSMLIGTKAFSRGEGKTKPARITITNQVEQIVKRTNDKNQVWKETYLTLTYEMNFHLPRKGQMYPYFRHTDTVQLPISKVTLDEFKDTLRALYKQYKSGIKNARTFEPIVVLE